MILNSNEEIKTIAQDLGMNHKTLYNYKRNNNLQTYVVNKLLRNSLEEENRRLSKEGLEEISLVKQECDILKKATAYFAKDGVHLDGELCEVCVDERTSTEFQYYSDVQGFKVCTITFYINLFSRFIALQNPLKS